MYLEPYFDAAALSQAQLQLQKRYLHRLVKSLNHKQGLHPTPITQHALRLRHIFIARVATDTNHTQHALSFSPLQPFFLLSLSFLSLFFLPLKSEPRLLLKSAMPRKQKSMSLQSRRGQHRRGCVYAKSNWEKGFMKKGVTVAWQITCSVCFFFSLPLFLFKFATGGEGRRGAHPNPFSRPFRLSVEECE